MSTVHEIHIWLEHNDGDDDDDDDDDASFLPLLIVCQDMRISLFWITQSIGRARPPRTTIQVETALPIRVTLIEPPGCEYISKWHASKHVHIVMIMMMMMMMTMTMMVVMMMKMMMLMGRWWWWWWWCWVEYFVFFDMPDEGLYFMICRFLTFVCFFESHRRVFGFLLSQRAAQFKV